MAAITDIGTRVEILSTDARCDGISIALYRQQRAEGPVGLVHTYSSRPGAAERIAFVARAMVALGGVEPAGDALLRFACGAWHQAAARRLFLEACRVDPVAPLAARPLEVLDRGTGQAIRAERLGRGAYRVRADGVAEGAESRALSVARSLAKLGELVSCDATAVSFPCGCDHDALAGLLLAQALNIRAALREEELAASRGVLTVPGAREPGS